MSLPWTQRVAEPLTLMAFLGHVLDSRASTAATPLPAPLPSRNSLVALPAANWVLIPKCLGDTN